MQIKNLQRNFLYQIASETSLVWTLNVDFIGYKTPVFPSPLTFIWSILFSRSIL